MASTAIGYETERPPSQEEHLSAPEFAPGLKPPSAGTYWRTARLLRWPQIVWLGRQQLRRRAHRKLPAMPGSVRLADFPQPITFPEWQPASARRMIENGEFDLLNLTVSDGIGIPWCATRFPRLWIYHLNYCDFVNLDLTRPEDLPLLRKALQVMVDWRRQNATGAESGWEPYPLSLRIVNWLKFLVRNSSQLETIGEKTYVVEILSCLECQVLVLERTLEFHLLANHLLKNIKALMFAGAMLETSGSDRWWEKGANLLGTQLREQILPDGGHFERSPMYHAQILDDLLDLETLVLATGRPLDCASTLSKSIDLMSGFLSAMLHPDGEIPLFNDSAFGVAPSARELLSRAARLSAAPVKADEKVKVLPDTGYAVIHEPLSKSCLILDCGPVGPDCQPGHAHCDVLSYELSLGGQRVVVDTGTSTYEPGPERHYERSTAAHNTLRVDGEEQAEIWASFRVGRRPKVGPIESGQLGGFRFVRASHEGYRRLGVIHVRQIILCPQNCWIVVDCLNGNGRHNIESFVHFHPEVRLEGCADLHDASSSELQKRFVIHSRGHRYCFLSLSKGTVELKDAWYSPEFGRRERQLVIYWKWAGRLPAQMIYAFVPAGRSIPSVKFNADSNSIKIDSFNIALT